MYFIYLIVHDSEQAETGGKDQVLEVIMDVEGVSQELCSSTFFLKLFKIFSISLHDLPYPST